MQSLTPFLRRFKLPAADSPLRLMGAYHFIQFLPLVIRMVLSEIFEIVAARLSQGLIRLWRKIHAGMTEKQRHQMTGTPALLRY
ncbi:MAG: hypothetical protein A2Z83_09710 [Omnitrophica bacterium GWA2_52_8]|nr:MAG: hypothetical protein A2Z83_09710 [Omnitrophica bacterium GWA2_52_8]